MIDNGQYWALIVVNIVVGESLADFRDNDGNWLGHIFGPRRPPTKINDVGKTLKQHAADITTSYGTLANE